MNYSFEDNNNNLRVIKTARTEEKINKAAKKGFYPLLKKVERDRRIGITLSVSQNKETGEILVWGSPRARYRNPDFNKFEPVLKYLNWYPYDFPTPYAAYLIPPDIKVGERVFLEDLIEDLVGSRHHGTYRLKSCEAIWNGNDFEIQYNEETDVTEWFG